MIIIFVVGIACGKVACRKSNIKAIAALTFLLNFLACVMVCGLCGKSIYQRYKVLKICDGEWTEASAKKIEEVYSEVEWDDPLRTDIQDAVLKKIESVQKQYDQKEIDYKVLEQRPGIIGYIVKEGDELWNLAKYYGTTKEGIMDINHMESEQLKCGDKLLIFKENASIL